MHKNEVFEFIDDYLNDNEFNEYCLKRNSGMYNSKIMVEAYYHGDINLHSFFQKLGKKTIIKILEDI